jgi:hypothetical protein
MKRLLTLLFLVVATGTIVNAQDGPAKIEVQKIWNEAPHSAFTSLVRFKNKFYCTFREAPGHISGPQGKARVIMSADEGKTWKSVAFYKMDGIDIRDPKLSVTPDNRLMVLIDVETYKDGKIDTRKPWVIYSDTNGENFSEPVASTVDPAIAEKSDWVWRVSWYKGMGYAIDYKNGKVFLVKTRDGKAFENVAKLDVDGSPNESTVRFDKKGKIYVVIRREQGDQRGVIATAEAPYTSWQYSKMDERIGGPDFLFLDDSTLCIGSRLYPQDPELQKKAINHKSAIFITDLQGKTKKVITIPESGGDCSYPGMLIYKNTLWYSYYSSHEDKTSIYLAKVPLSLLTK